MTYAQPMHTTHIMHTWRNVQLWRVTWDSYVWISTFVAQEMSNERFTILEPVLPIASKRRVIHYLESLKRKKKVLLQAQTNKQGCSYKLKSIYIYGVHLELLPQTSLGGTCLPSLSLPTLVRHLPWVDLGLYLYLYLSYRTCMFNSRRICGRNL